jgi:Ser/Thr protein kinase RdoA (MazF antagonist)
VWAERDVRAFLAEYGLAPERVAAQQMVGWWWNLVLRIDADGETLVLRRWGATPPEEVRWEVALMQHLVERGFPTISSLPRVDGAPCGVFEGRPAFLYRYLEGTCVPWSDQKRVEMEESARQRHEQAPWLDLDTAMAGVATTIAWLHDLTEGLVLPYPRERSGTDTRRTLRKFLDFVAQRGVAPEERALADVVGRTQEMCDAFEARLAPRESELRRGIVHHDAHFGNSLFLDGRFAALIDFDDACPGYLMADLAVLLGSWGMDRAADGLLPERAALLVREYERRRPLRPAEREMLPDFLAMYLLGDAAQFIGDSLAAGEPSDKAISEDRQFNRFLCLTSSPDWRERMQRSITR